MWTKASHIAKERASGLFPHGRWDRATPKHDAVGVAPLKNEIAPNSFELQNEKWHGKSEKCQKCPQNIKALFSGL